MNTPLHKAQAAVSRMIESGDHVLAAVSGGPDSVCLLHLLNRMKEAGGFRLSVAHLNHGVRGAEADADARFVKALAQDLGLSFHGGSCDAKREREKLKTSFQDAARILRSRFLESTMQRIGADKLALGHTADDQAETLLMHLLRGSGLKGLGGMEATRGALVRPLIECSREEVLQFLRSHGHAWRTDSSNLETDYLRNRIRLELIPELESYNPNVRERLFETARILREDESLLSEWTESRFRDCARPVADGFELDADGFARLHPALQKRLLRRAVAGLNGSTRKITARHIDAARKLILEGGAGKEIHLPDAITIRRAHAIFRVETNPRRARGIQHSTDVFQPVDLAIPGTTAWQEAGIAFQTHISASGKPDTQDPHLACFDFESTGECVRVRTFRPGDRFVPLGMQGRKKVKSFFIDEKIPRAFRRAIPILTTGTGDIIWIYGKRISERHRVTERTKRVLWIKGVEISGV